MLYLKPLFPLENKTISCLLSAVDLMDSSLIQLVLLRHCSCEARESPLPVQQLFRALRELFQRVGEEKPGQVHPRASELTLSLLTTLYDRWGCEGHAVASRTVFSHHRSLATWCRLRFAWCLLHKKASLFSTNVLFIQEGDKEVHVYQLHWHKWPVNSKKGKNKSTLLLSHTNSFPLWTHALLLLGWLSSYTYKKLHFSLGSLVAYFFPYFL